MLEKVKFKDETWFEGWLKSKGFELHGNYPTNYFTTYGTISREYVKNRKVVSIGLIGSIVRCGIADDRPSETIVGIRTSFPFAKNINQVERLMRLPTNEPEAIERMEAIGINDCI